MELEEAFGLALKEIRGRVDLLQSEFEPAASREYMSMLERGQRTPGLGKIDAIAKVVGVHPLTLIARCYLILHPDELSQDVMNRVTAELAVLDRPPSNPFSSNE